MVINTLSIENTIIKLDAIRSTNEYAHKLLLKYKNTVEGTVVWAVDQTNGKGQRGTLWHSQPGRNLTFSLIMYPGFINIENQFVLSKVVSLGIKDFLDDSLHVNMADSDFKVRIKWPNDIYVGSKKICGILIENNVRETTIVSSITGIGININQVTFPKDLHNTVSYKSLTGLEMDLKETLHAILSSINARYQQLKSNKIAAINHDYLEALYQFGIFANYQVKNQEMSCKIIDVNQKGELLLEGKDRNIIICDLKEVIFI